MKKKIESICLVLGKNTYKISQVKFKMLLDFYQITKKPAYNEHIGEIAAVSPQKRQCKFESYYPARTFVKPLPRQYAGSLCASGRKRGRQRRKELKISLI